MKIVTEAAEIDLGPIEENPTIGIIDYSRRETDAFGVTTVVKRDFARRMSVRMALSTAQVDEVQRQLAALRATPAQWIADARFAWLSFAGFYKDFTLDLAVPPTSFCTLTVEGLAESEPGPDTSGDPAPAGSASTLRLVQPVDIDGEVLVSSSVDEFDYPQWSAGTTYAAGVRVLRLQSHRVFESAAAGNIGHDPADPSGHWIDLGPTNRWAMFDQALGTSTIADGAITVALDVTAIDALALLDVVGAAVRVEAPGYDRTQSPGTGAITFLDLPQTTGEVVVTITGAGTVSVGTLLAGRLVDLGVTEAAPTAGITDYSRKETDDFGEVTIVERAWAKRMTAKAMIRTDAIDDVANRIAAVRARPCLWIGDEGLDSLTVYGFFKEFSIDVGPAVSFVSLSIEGLSQAAPKGTLPTVTDWPSVIDSDPVNHPKPEDGATVGAPPGTVVGTRPVEDVLAELAAAQALAAEIQDQADALAGLIDGLVDEVTANAIEIQTIDTTVAAHSSTIALQGSAIAGLTGDLATVTTRVSAGARNLLKNSGFENGLDAWGAGAGVWTTHNDSYGTYARTYSTGNPYLDSPYYPAFADSPYTASGDLYLTLGGGSGAGYVSMIYYDASYGYLGESAWAQKSPGDFSTDHDGRVEVTDTTPPNTAFIVFRVAGSSLSGSPVLAARRLKLENAAFMSQFSQEASVVQTFTALTALGLQFSGLSSTVATLGSQVASSAEAITDLNTNVATLTTRLSAGAQNLLKNGNFETAFSGTWTPAYGAWSIESDAYGRYAYSPTVALTQLYSDPIPASAERAYTASANMHFDAPDGNFILFIAFYNSANVHLGNSALVHKTRGQPFTTDLDGRVRVTETAPAGTAYARVIVQGESTIGPVSRAVKEVKFENGATMSPYSQEASVFQQAQAISSVEGQVSTLVSEVATQGSLIASTATAISDVEGDVALLSQTVQAQGVSVTQHASAISTLNSNVATAFARLAVRLDVNGYWIGWEANNNGTTGSIKFRADHLEISHPAGGGFQFINGVMTKYYPSGQLGFRLG